MGVGVTPLIKPTWGAPKISAHILLARSLISFDTVINRVGVGEDEIRAPVFNPAEVGGPMVASKGQLGGTLHVTYGGGEARCDERAHLNTAGSDCGGNKLKEKGFLHKATRFLWC